MKTRTLFIEGMTCNHCVMSVKKALEELGAKADVSLEKSTADIQYDENKLTLDDLKNAVNEAGYSAGE
ncbi:MAG: heavy-metal-associated domain-containing protein [Spirochaetia bacterium]|nr:heavy-metal-associated domain-containing protein [Spirochaetia bacterium]